MTLRHIPLHLTRPERGLQGGMPQSGGPVSRNGKKVSLMLRCGNMMLRHG